MAYTIYEIGYYDEDYEFVMCDIAINNPQEKMDELESKIDKGIRPYFFKELVAREIHPETIVTELKDLWNL